MTLKKFLIQIYGTDDYLNKTSFPIDIFLIKGKENLKNSKILFFNKNKTSTES